MSSAERNFAYPLQAADLCAIIESCGKAGVRVFKSGGVYISFEAPKKKIAAPSAYPLLPPSDLRASLPDHVAQNKETLKTDEQEVKEERLRMLMIEDPMEYERQLRDGELDDEPGESDESE